MACIWVTFAFSLLLFALLLRPWLFNYKNKHKKLPPGPKGLPIFGSLHLLGKLPHRDLHRLSQTYGPIMHLRFGLVPTIVVSSPQAAELFLKTHDLVFASRPFSETSNLVSYGQKGLGFCPYGSYWRRMRKMFTLELLNSSKINSFKSMRKNELGLLIDSLRAAANNRVVVNLSSKVSSLIVDMTCLMVFGKKYPDKEFDERGFKAVIQEVLQLASAPNLSEFIPFLELLDLQGVTRRLKSVSKVFDGFLERIIDEHLEPNAKDKNSRDFVDVMLELMCSEESEYHIDRSVVKALMLDVLVAATDTSATVVGWAISELIKHPQAMKKLQNEIQVTVGLNRMVEESDLEAMKYLDMVVKEILRLHPSAPLLLPHESIEDCTVNGFHIPKKSRLIINAWAIGRDPSAWTDAEKFFPERFIGSQVDVRGRDFQLIPFGSGRRGCPGLQLGLTVVRIVVAQLVHCFDWELPDGDGISVAELDMTEVFGLTCPRAKDLMLIPIYRLCN